MKDITYEARSIMGYLGFKRLTQNEEAVEECHRLLLKADSRHDIKKSKIGTLRVAYIRNGCLSYLRKMRGEKYQFHSKMCTIIQERYSEGKNGLIPETLIPFKEENKGMDVDGELLLTYIRKCSILDKRDKDMIYDKYVVGLTFKEISEKYKLTQSKIVCTFTRVFKKIRKNVEMDVFLC